MKKMYEFIYILPARLEKKDKLEIQKDLKSIFNTHKAVIIKENDWGEKTMAYSINHEKHGHYFIWNVEIPHESAEEIRRLINFQENILRYLILQIPANALAGADKEE